MPYSYIHASEDEKIRSDTEGNHSDGFVVYDTDTNREYGVYQTEVEAQQICENLNRGETPKDPG